jgi:hypothetical protein
MDYKMQELISASFPHFPQQGFRKAEDPESLPIIFLIQEYYVMFPEE